MTEKESFEQLVEDHLGRLYSYCLAETCDLHEAEELAQEVLLRAYLKFPTLKDRNAFSSWLIGIAKRCRWNFFRRVRRDPLRQRNPDGDLERLEAVPDAGRNPAGQLEENENTKLLLEAISKLPRGQRQAIVMRYFEELSYTKIAARLGVTEDAVDQRLTRAKKKLRDLLKLLEH